MSLGEANLDPIRRSPGRPRRDAETIRPPVRDDRLEARIAEIRGSAVSADDGTDAFFVDPRIIPDGWSYEWKREETIGKHDHQHQLHVKRRGWEPVPQERHPDILVRQSGMILMERPLEITRDVFEQNQVQARLQIQTKEEQLGEATAPETRTREAARQTGVRKTFEHHKIPD